MAGVLDNSVIVIIGGTSGIGLSAARACMAAGAQVALVGKEEGEARVVQAELGERCIAMAADAREAGTAEQAIAAAVEKFGGVDGVYHVAGGSGRRMGDGAVHEITDEGWRFTMELNLTSVFYTNRAAVRYFLERGRGGAILNMASVLGYAPSERFFSTHAYAAAKAGIIGLVRSAAARYAKENIRINAIAPGLVETPMAQRAANDPAIMSFIRTKQPLDGGRIGLPADLDAAAIFFLSDASKFCTGQVLAIDGGWSISDGQYPEGT